MNIKEETVYSNVETANSKQLAILKKHFPNCFDRDGNFIQERMLEVVNEGEIELSKESYSLNWLGKSYSRLLANLPPKTLIHADAEHNAQEQHKDSKNLLIKGDNLEVLKHLVNAYSEKVKMIYIDPPYNTGLDGFVYNDDRKFTKEQLSELAGIDIDEAERILSFADQGSSSHSAWLTFMYPRLYVAKEFLQEDGVIFISIDDNEVNQLRLICDEVFGESNFLGTIIWKKKTNGNNVGYIPPVHDYILAYGRTNLEAAIAGVPFTQEYIDKTYSNPDNDPRGPWTTSDLSANHEGPHFPIINEKTGKTYLPPSGRYWVFNEEEVKRRITDGRIIFGKTGNAAPIQKKYLSERVSQRTKAGSWWDSNGLNSDGTKEIASLLGPKIFEHSKPTQLIKDLIRMSTDSGDVVLDFFAGSGTTAHSVYLSNIEDKKDRRVISVQLEEPTDPKKGAYKAGFRTIFEITKQRIIEAAKKLGEQNSDYKGDLGFKLFEIVNDFRLEDEDKELALANLTMFDDVLLTDEQYQTLLTTWALYDGSELTAPIYDIDLGGYTAHLCDRRLYMIAPDFSSDALKTLLHKLDDTDDKDFDPNKIVYYANNFDSVKQMELNEALKSYANKKSIEIDVVVRN